MCDINTKPPNSKWPSEESNDCRQPYIYSQKYSYLHILEANPPAAYTELIAPQLMSSTFGHRYKLVEEWTEDETIAWLVDTIQFSTFSIADLPFYRFNITGEQLLRLTQDDINQKVKHPNVPPHRSQRISEFLFSNIRRHLHQTDPDLSEKIHHLDLDKSAKENSGCNSGNDKTSENATVVDCIEKESTQRSPGRPKNGARKDKTGPKHVSIVEFLRDLLMDPHYCPDVISWENYSEGTFRFNKPATAAKLWGDRNNNSNMNFEKFTRAMRYHYASKKLTEHPARLIYKFGPNGPNIKTDDPNFEKSRYRGRGFSNSDELSDS